MPPPCVVLLALAANLATFAHGSRGTIYAEVASSVSPGAGRLGDGALHSLFAALEDRVQCPGVSCGKCLSAEHVGQVVGNYSSARPVDLDGFFRLAAGCCFYLSSAPQACRAVRQGRWGEETEAFLRAVTGHGDSGGRGGGPASRRLNFLLHNMDKYYTPDSKQNCLTTTHILEEIDASRHHAEDDLQNDTVDAMFGIVLYHALRGDCMTANELPEKEYFLDFIFSRYGPDNVTLEALESLMKALNLGARKQHVDVLAHDHQHDHDHRKLPRHSHREGHQPNSSWDQSCFSATDVLKIYGLNQSGLSRDQFAQISPALVQQLLSKACTDAEATPEPTDGLSKTERYVYATIANLLICLMAMLGIVTLLCTSCSSVFQLCIQFCISLAVGSLTGDALLHLLPTVLGLHVHGTEDKHGHSEGGSDYTYKLLVLMSGIYYFYLMEAIFSIISRKRGHQHHHGEVSDPHHCDHDKVIQMYQREKKNKHSISQADLVEGVTNEKTQEDPSREKKLLPYMITIGDGIHNFADGLAIGAAFSISWKSGLATSLAVLCHELPHELGDFAILLDCGISVKKALLLNLGSAMTSFVGLYISLSIATDSAAIEWISAVTAGLFLYVGLADMLPSMIHVKSDRPWLMLFLQNIGLLSGWGILLLLSFYEDKIVVF
ncbi:zinc transporter ZIP4 [Denticeps clupeoides]|uniref:Zinc transporter ZIP4 n=1 Tax=Denticeps clupeoides TaxID=299321 RepID=A0AAY4D9L3_9TELE|nr:zinc transporter ZIP4-like [Denticeps clupeoides]XP_028820551.1 zinc transporter ZIP4-like [Denticeps clupeoides]XP_028820552.1 zinc transporter ZIP4-like [Denticeps clupeoides]